MSKFQIILLCVFGFFIVVAVMVFALYRGGGGTRAAVTVWGDISANDVHNLLGNSQLGQDSNITISYIEKPTETIVEEFTEALAEGRGPDLIIVTQDKFLEQKSKLVPIPYGSISERDFKNTFVEEGELFLAPEGVYAMPISVDPIVLYYNRDHLSSAGQARPIAFWDEIYLSATALNKRDAAGNLVQSAIALGETRNILHAKDILSMLMLQAGTPITGFLGPELRSVLSDNLGQTVSPGESALDFYTQFSNPTKAYYSWNRTMPEAQTRFTSGDSTYYLGFASELTTLRNKNPTLNFTVASVPQSRVSGKTITFGIVRGVAISRGTKNPVAALDVVLKLISKEHALTLSQLTGLPPARRDLLGERPTDAVTPVFYTAALQARGWLDPDDEASADIFADMVEEVTSGRARLSETIGQASRELDSLIK